MAIWLVTYLLSITFLCSEKFMCLINSSTKLAPERPISQLRRTRLLNKVLRVTNQIFILIMHTLAGYPFNIAQLTNPMNIPQKVEK